MRKKSPTLVCRLSTPLTTKTLEHVVPACVLPCAQVLAAMVVAAAGSELAHNPNCQNCAQSTRITIDPFGADAVWLLGEPGPHQLVAIRWQAPHPYVPTRCFPPPSCYPKTRMKFAC